MNFNRIIQSGIVLLLYACSATADISWEQQSIVSDNGYTETTQQKIYFTSDKFAFDSGDGMRIIVDIPGNTITTIDENQKIYFISDIDEIAQQMEALKTQSEEILADAIKNIPEDMREEYEKSLRDQLNNGEDDTAKPEAEKYKPTGKSSKIAGYTAHQYIAVGENGTTYMMWCTRDINLPELQTFYNNLGQIGFFKDISPDPELIKLGFPVKSMEKSGNTTVMTEVISVSTESLTNNSVFSVPDGLTQSDEVFLPEDDK